MLLTYSQLCKLVDNGVIVSVPHEHINGASIDVTLGNRIWTESQNGSTVDLASKQSPRLEAIDLSEGDYLLRPGEFILAQTQEVFNLPNDIAFEFKLKSSVARSGLNHLLAGYADPGWHGSVLTLELHNTLQYHQLRITAGLKIGQIVFYRGLPVPHDRSYAVRGQYNNSQAAQPSKGIR